MERAAPEPRRASIDSSREEKSWPYAADAATVSAANPEALEANPAAVGKLFFERTTAR